MTIRGSNDPIDRDTPEASGAMLRPGSLEAIGGVPSDEAEATHRAVRGGEAGRPGRAEPGGGRGRGRGGGGPAAEPPGDLPRPVPDDAAAGPGRRRDGQPVRLV